MLRMSVLALTAAAALGTAALTPTAASAEWHGWGRDRDRIEDRFERRDRIEDRLERRDRFEGRFEHRDSDDCFRVRQFWTPWGWTLRRIWVCG
jgi:hypothetical protein